MVPLSDSLPFLRSRFATVSVSSGSPMSGVDREGVHEQTIPQEKKDNTLPSYYASFVVSLYRIFRKDFINAMLLFYVFY